MEIGLKNKFRQGGFVSASLGSTTLPARPHGGRQEAEHESEVLFDGRSALLAVALVHLAGMAAQLLDGSGGQAGGGEGVDEHIQQGNEVGVVEGVLVVISEPVLDLAFAEMQQEGFRVCDGRVFGLRRRGMNAGGCRGTPQWRQRFGGKAEPDASRLAWHACNQSTTLQGQNHLMHARRCDLEEVHHFCFRRRTPVQSALVVYVGQILALARGVRWFHWIICRPAVALFAATAAIVSDCWQAGRKPRGQVGRLSPGLSLPRRTCPILSAPSRNR